MHTTLVIFHVPVGKWVLKRKSTCIIVCRHLASSHTETNMFAAQVIWGDTTKFGIAVATNPSGYQIVVGEYGSLYS